MIKKYEGIRIVGLRCAVVAGATEKAADIGCRVAEELLESYSVVREDVNVLIYVTQSPMFMTPSTSFYISKRLNFGQNCYQYDVNLGATGMLVGTQLLASLMLSFKDADKGLLLMADDNLKDGLTKKTMASAILFEKCAEENVKIWIQNRSFGEFSSLYLQGENDKVPSLNDEFYTVGEGVLKNQMQRMMHECDNEKCDVKNKIFSKHCDSAARLPMMLEKENVQGYSLLGAMGAGMSVATMFCDLSKDIYKHTK